MKKTKLLILCAVLLMGSVFVTACGRSNNMNNGTEAPYQDETQNNVNDTNKVGNDLRDAGNNLLDSIRDTGNAIRDGVNNMTDKNKTNP